jgi:hypothetical protein
MKGKRQMKQVRWLRIIGLAAISLMLSLELAAQGDLAAMQQKLDMQFKLTTTTANQSDIVTAGDVIAVQKEGLKLSALASPLMESNTYKDGKIGGGAAKRAWGGFGVALLQGVAAGLDTSGATSVPDSIPGRTMAVGEKCWITAVTAQKDGINFKLYTDADDNGIRYHANLKILFPNKKQVPSVDAAMKLVSEVLTSVSGDNQGSPDASQASAPPPPPAPLPEIAPPPPPPDAPPPTIAIGQTRNQVIAGFGLPLRSTKLGVKEICYYKDMKVTFRNGKVSNVE